MIVCKIVIRVCNSDGQMLHKYTSQWNYWEELKEFVLFCGAVGRVLD